MTSAPNTGSDPVDAPGALDESTADLVLPPHPTSPRAARRFVAEHLTAAGLSDVLDTALLLVSEVVTNAVLHARTDLRLRARVLGSWLMVEVVAENHDRPHVREAPETAVSGRGLALVATLADRWGVEHSTAGKTVWFTLTRPANAALLPLPEPA